MFAYHVIARGGAGLQLIIGGRKCQEIDCVDVISKSNNSFLRARESLKVLNHLYSVSIYDKYTICMV